MLHELQVRITALRKLHIECALQLLIEMLDGKLVFSRELLERLEPADELQVLALLENGISISVQTVRYCSDCDIYHLSDTRKELPQPTQGTSTND